jgi:D-alanyl-D-alanine carboxypeptidase/D-alanyl-D-alanine carboxypeptidase (penicillin-binding protein 5/6)
VKRLLAAALSAVFAVMCGFGAARAAELRLVPEASGNGVGAAAAVLVEAMTGRVLFSQDADLRLPMASTTKIMTALIALEQETIEAFFPVDSAAIAVEGSSMGLKKGDSVSLRALAAGMLLSSGNDAANAAAVRIAGSTAAFAGLMNARAAEMGLFNTRFVTPSGLDAEGHYSSAQDMAELTREALKNPEFAGICSQYKLRASFGAPPYERWLTNHNKLLNYYEHAVGVKTGFTGNAGRCLVSAAEKDGVTLICVTLDCPNDWKIHEELLERGFGMVSVEDLSRAAPSVSVPVTGGVKPSVRAVFQGPAPVPIPVGASDIEYRAVTGPFVYAPVLKGQYLGEVAIIVDGTQVFRLTLTAAEEIPLLHEYKEGKSLWDYIKAIFGK